MSDDWQVVEDALREWGESEQGFTRWPNAVAALARLREREAQLEEFDRKSQIGLKATREFYEARVARLEEALRELTGKRITDAEGWATWAKNVARRALAHEEEK